MNSERVRACVLIVFLTLLPLALLQSDRQSMQGEAHALAVTRRPLSKRLLVVLIDGLPAYAVYQEQWMPWLRTQLSRAAHGTGAAPIPSLTPPGLRSIFAGRDSAPRPELPGAWPLAPEPDSVFARARDAGLVAHIVGYEDWTKLFGGHGASMSVVSY